MLTRMYVLFRIHAYAHIYIHKGRGIAAAGARGGGSYDDLTAAANKKTARNTGPDDCCLRAGTGVWC